MLTRTCFHGLIKMFDILFVVAGLTINILDQARGQSEAQPQYLGRMEGRRTENCVLLLRGK